MIADQSSKKVKDSCINISKVLQKISRCSLFSAEDEFHYTLFNHYIIEIIPKLNELYEKIIDVDINNMPTMETNKICIVFSIDAIIMLNTILTESKSKFEELPNSKFFTKTINRIKNQEGNLNYIQSNSSTKNFCAIFNWDRIPNDSNIEDKIQLNQIENGSSNKVAQVKFCIKTILKGLNIVNKKIYSHLNRADSNEQFILALKEIIDIEKYNVNDSDNYLKSIPLSWYSLYMTSNLWKDDNDFEWLYDELYKEEEEKFMILEKQYNENAIETGIIEQCVLNKLEKNRSILIRKNMENIISLGKRIFDSTQLALCIRRIEPITNHDNDKNNEKEKSSKSVNKICFWNKNSIVANDEIYQQTKESFSYIEVTHRSQCIHSRLMVMNKVGNFTNKNIPFYHTHTIKQFAKQLCTFDEVVSEITKGNNNHCVLETIHTAISLLENTLYNTTLTTTTKFQIKEQINKNQKTGNYQNDRISLIHLTPEDKIIFKEYIEDFILRKIHKR